MKTKEQNFMKSAENKDKTTDVKNIPVIIKIERTHYLQR